MIKRIIILITFLTFISCSKNKKIEIKIIPTSNTEKIIVEQKENLNPEKIKRIISKKWFSNTIQSTDKTLVFNSINTTHSISKGFIIEFKPDGILNFQNTTKKYVCGNGVPYFDKATWGFKKGLYNIKSNDFDLTNNLVLHIRGGQLLENRFEFKREYLIKSISKNKIELVQVNSILEKYITDGNNFFEE